MKELWLCLPVKFENMGTPEYNKGPLIGEQSYEIAESLGYSKEEIQAMLDDKDLFIWKEGK